MTRREDIEGLRDAARSNGAWIGTTATGRRMFDRMPLLDEICELALEALDRRFALASEAEKTRAAMADYDARETAGEDVSGDVRPRAPGGSDW